MTLRLDLITYGSAFTGIGGFDRGFDAAGMTCRWQVEIDDACQRVLSHHWPDVPKHRDIRDVRGDELEPVDVICGGFPCQDLSVAGRRAGLHGERSSMFFEFMRVVKEMRDATGGQYPEFIAIENVPGLLNSNGGADMDIVLDTIEGLGFIPDVDILDAQHFGVAQRRRRVFIVCHSVVHIRQRRTRTSALTISQCLSEILLVLLAELSRQSTTAFGNWDCPSGLSVDGLKRRMTLFDLPTANDHWSMLLESWDDETRKSSADTAAWDFRHGAGSDGAPMTGPVTSSGKVSGGDSRTARADSSWSTGPSWRSILDDLCDVARSCITSTESRTTTESTIYTCALMSESIASLICRLNDYSPTYWSAASSALTTMEAFTSYARQAGNSLFTPVEWVQPWADFHDRATRTRQSLRDSPIRCWGEILALSEGLSGHPPPRRAEGQGTAGGAGTGVEVSGPLGTNANGGHRQDLDTGGAYIPLLEVGARTNGDGERDGDGIGEPGDPMYTLQAGKQHGVLQPVAADLAQVTSKGNYSNPKPGDPRHPLTSAANQSIVALPIAGEATTHTGEASDGVNTPGISIGNENDPMYALNSSKQHAIGFYHTNRQPEFGNYDDISPTVKVGSSEGDNPPAAVGIKNPVSVASQMAVRRLTPTECLRLMSFPDDWLDLDPPLSDSTQYRMCGNAVVCNVAEWIGKRIVEVLR